MKIKKKILINSKFFYGLMLLGIFLSSFGLRELPVAQAKAGPTGTPTKEVQIQQTSTPEPSEQEQMAGESSIATPSGVIAKLDSDQTFFSIDKNINLRVTLFNPNSYSIKILKWYLPSAGVAESLFKISLNGETVQYLGALSTRPEPTDEDYIILQAGEDLTQEIDISLYYDFSISGDYKIVYDVNSDELFLNPNNKNAKYDGNLESNEVALFIEGRPAPEHKKIIAASVSGSTAFSSCSTSQQAALGIIRSSTSSYASESLSYFTAGKTGLRYTTWFGIYEPARYNTVKANFGKISAAAAMAGINFDCSSADLICSQNTVAYVYPSWPYNIFLCSSFWSYPVTGDFSQAGVVLHELSHFSIVANTDDHVYGRTNSKNLAISNPYYAIWNADTYRYFAENTPPVNDPDSFEPDNISGQAKWVYSGIPQVHNIMPVTDIDWVKFQLNSKSAILVETSELTYSDTRMWLFDSSLVQVDYSDDEGVGYFSLIDRVCGIDPLPAGTYYIKIDDFNNDTEIPSYNLSFNARSCPSNSINTLVNGERQGSSLLSSNESVRQSYPGVNAGPVQITNSNTAPIIGAERVIYNVGGKPVSFSEMMGLPASQVSTTYWMPWYNNVDLDTQLRFGNVSGSPASVHVYIGGVEMTGSPFSLTASGAGQSTRVSFAGINGGPVKIVSDVAIVAAERVIYNVGGGPTSFIEMMGLPNSQLSTTYWMPWYNNVDLDTQLRFGNVSGSPASVHVYIGGVEMAGSPFSLTASGAGQSTRVSFTGINGGPVKIVSDVPIVASERVIYSVNGVPTSFSEMMGVPNALLNTTYWMPWYNNVDLDTQLRFGNVSGSSASVHVYIGGVEMAGSPFSLTASGAGQSMRISFAGTNGGPVKIVSDVPIVAAERVIYNVNGVPVSFSEMMGLPNNLLSTTYWLPWYNNVDLDTQLRFGVP